MTPSEAFTFKLSQHTFLSMWSYANPQSRNGKELCDILVVCDPDVIIISVKDCVFKDTGVPEVDWKRWTKNAIDDSVKQIYGAERWVRRAQNVVRQDGSPGLPLPPPDRRVVHRVAVALGSRGEVPISAGDFGKGFVHVLTEGSVETVLSELDTISDFVCYLSDKEKWFASLEKLIVSGGEENLLAVYLHNGRAFPTGADHYFLDGDTWEAVQKKPEYQRKKAADQESYLWDRIIEEFSQHALAGTLEIGNSLTDAEQLVRTMTREPRFQRRVLAKHFKGLMAKSRETPMARIVKSERVTYVFLAAPLGMDRERRLKELQIRCFVARGLNHEFPTVVGIGTEQLGGKGRSFDGLYLNHEKWTEENEKQMTEYQAIGIFANPMKTPFTEMEYPEDTSNR